MTWSLRRLLAVVVAIMSWHGAAVAGCEVQPRASVGFTLEQGRITVPLVVNGRPALFILDTGAERSMVTPAAVRRLGLALDQWVDTTMSGVGGVVEHANADPRSLELGGVVLRRATLAHDNSLTVGALPGGGGAAVDGLLGRDFLSVFDLQFDMPARRLTLYDVRGCSGRFLPWSGHYFGVPAAEAMTRALVLPIVLDGRRLSALLDTGAWSSLLTLPGMIRMGLTPQTLAGDQVAAAHGVGRQTPAMYRHRFASLDVGGETIARPMLWVARVRVAPIVDGLLGADWLDAQRRVWLSFTTSQVFFQPR